MNTSKQQPQNNPAMRRPAKFFVGSICVLGSGMLGYGLAKAQFPDYTQFFTLLAAAMVAARLKVKLPGMTGTMSVNLPFVLLAVSQLSLVEALIVACASTLVQTLPTGTHRFQPVHALFNFGNMALSAGLAAFVMHASWFASATVSTRIIGMTLAAATYFLGNTIPVAGILWLTDGPGLLEAWHRIFQWSFPYYLAGAGVACMVNVANRFLAWYIPLLALPLMYAVFHSYQMFFGMSQATDAGRTPMATARAQAAAAH